MKSQESKPTTLWRVALGPPPGTNVPFRRTAAKTYASVVENMAKSPPSTSVSTSPSPPPESRGKIAFVKGGKFENELGAVLTSLYDKETKVPLLKEFTPSNTPSEEDDAVIMWKGKKVSIEAKNLGTSEGGQRAFVLTNDKLMIPDIPRNRIHRACLPPNFLPFEGRIPSFKKGDISHDTWEKEKEFFRDQRIRCSPTAIAEYYKMKGSSYIQIQGMGLYHTGEDVCGWGVPLFQCPTQVRIRCKTHRGHTPTTVQAALNFNRQRLQPSPFCLFKGPLPQNIMKLYKGKDYS